MRSVAIVGFAVAVASSVVDAVTSTRLAAIKKAKHKDLVVKVAPAFHAHMLAAKNLDKQLVGK